MQDTCTCFPLIFSSVESNNAEHLTQPIRWPKLNRIGFKLKYMYYDSKILLQHRQHCYYDFVQYSEPASTCSLQEILALTGGGKTREYTETRPDGSTVTYTIDVEEEEYEVFARETIFNPTMVTYSLIFRKRSRWRSRRRGR